MKLHCLETWTVWKTNWKKNKHRLRPADLEKLGYKGLQTMKLHCLETWIVWKKKLKKNQTQAKACRFRKVRLQRFANDEPPLSGNVNYWKNKLKKKQTQAKACRFRKVRFGANPGTKTWIQTKFYIQFCLNSVTKKTNILVTKKTIP